MLYVKQIMSLFGCDKELALQVFQGMCIDFSECTDAEFKREATFIYGKLTGGK